MTLLINSENSFAKNSSFEDKVKFYDGSGIPLTDELKTCQKWGIDSIDENQTKYAKIAKAIWKL